MRLASRRSAELDLLEDRAGVLVAVVDAVAVGVRLVRIVAGLELAEVVEAVVVRVAPGLLDLERQVVTALPPIGDPVVVAVHPRAARTRAAVVPAGGRRARQQHERRGERGDDAN